MDTAFNESGELASPLLDLSPSPAVNAEAVYRHRAARRRADSQIAIILTIGACVMALLWLIMAVVIDTERRTAIKHAYSEANNLSAAFQVEVGEKLSTVARAMDAVAEHMRAANGTFDIFDWARTAPLLSTGTVQGAIVGPDGIMLSTTLEPHAAPLDLSDREHFRVHLSGTFKGIYVSKPVLGRASGQTVIQLSRRVDAADGRFLGVIVFSLAPAQLTTLHRSVDLGERGRLIVVGATDHVIRARFGVGSETGNLGIGEWVPPPPGLVDDAGGAQTFIRESVIDHVTRLHSSRMIPGYKLRVAVALDLDDVLRPVAAHAWLIKALGVIATVMLAGLLTLLIVEIRRRTNREIKLGDEQDRLRASEARLRDFAEMASDWFWEMDADLRFTISSSDGATRVSREQFIGKQPWEIFDTTQAPELWAMHRRTMVARRPFRDFRHTRPGTDGRAHHVSINGVPVFDAAGQFLGYRGTGRDVTAKVESEAALRRSRDEAEASNLAKSTFLANMSHELRTPLNAIIGFADLIHARKSGRITPDYVEWAGDILASGRHLLAMINDVLELSRIESGRYDLANDTVDLAAVVRSCLSMVRRQAESNQVRIHTPIDPASATVRGDQRAVTQVMLNLISNAVKFTPAGGSVTVRTERAATGEFSLIVADTGIGIDPAVLPRLCEPFVQADASTSRTYGGTGLGLAISSKIMALHGGSLTIASAPGQGTKVWASFPVSRSIEVPKQTESAV
jgi:PAS domain S-box-containing protein